MTKRQLIPEGYAPWDFDQLDATAEGRGVLASIATYVNGLDSDEQGRRSIRNEMTARAIAEGWSRAASALDEVKRLQDQMAEVSAAFRNGSVGGDFDTLHSYLESALAEVETAPDPKVPNPLTVVYTKYAVRFVDSAGNEFQPMLVDALEVIRVMSEYARMLANDLLRREAIARDTAGQPAKTSLLRDIAARISDTVPNPWAGQDREILCRMATYGEEVWAAGEVQAAKERQQR